MSRIVLILLLLSSRLCAQVDFGRMADEDVAQLSLRGFLKPEFKWDMEGKVQASLNETINLLDEERRTRALGEIDAALKLDQTSWVLFYYRGVILKMLGEQGMANHTLTLANKLKPEDFYINVELGKVNYLQKRYDVAERYYESAIKINPASAIPHYLLAAVYLRASMLGKAKRTLAHCLDVDSTFFHGEVDLALLESKEKQNPKSAISRLESVLKKDSTNRLALIYHAGLILEDDQAACLKDLDALVNLDPSNMEFRAARGVLATTLRDFRKAYFDLQKVVNQFNMDEFRFRGQQTSLDKQIDIKHAGTYVVSNVYGLPDDDASSVKKAYCLLFTSEFDESLKAMQPVKGASTNPLCLYLKGVANEHKGNHTAAFFAYDSALRYDPDNYDAHKKRGIYSTELNRWEVAANDFNEMLRINPRSVTALHFRGIVYYNQGKLHAALKDFSKYLAVDSTNEEVHRYRGVVYHDLKLVLPSTLDLLQSDRRDVVESDEIIFGAIQKVAETDKPKAMWYVNELIRLNYLRAHTMKLSVLMTWNEWEEAERQADLLMPDMGQDVRPGVRMWKIYNEQDRAFVHTTKGMCLAKKNKTSEALAQFDRALEMDPKNGITLLERGKVHLKLGDKPAALKDLKKASRQGIAEATTLMAEAEVH